MDTNVRTASNMPIHLISNNRPVHSDAKTSFWGSHPPWTSPQSFFFATHFDIALLKLPFEYKLNIDITSSATGPVEPQERLHRSPTLASHLDLDEGSASTAGALGAWGCGNGPRAAHQFCTLLIALCSTFLCLCDFRVCTLLVASCFPAAVGPSVAAPNPEAAETAPGPLPASV
eukprot:3573600-Amphidinium_carterae.1